MLLDEVNERAKALKEMEMLFELNVSAFRDISLCRSELKFLKGLWDMITILFHLFESWKKILWDDIDTDQLLLECKDLKQQLDDMPREIKSWKAYLGAQDQVKNLALVLPLVNILHSPSMQDRHWEELASVTKKVFDVGPTFCLADLLKLQVRTQESDISSFSSSKKNETKKGREFS